MHRSVQVAFMVKWCTGIVCCPMDEAFCDRLKLPLMVEQNEEYYGTKFCVTVDGGPAMGTPRCFDWPPPCLPGASGLWPLAAVLCWDRLAHWVAVCTGRTHTQA